MAETSLKNRIFAASGAVLFFISFSALTVAVIIQVVHDNKQKAAQAQADTCKSKEPQEPLTAPAAFKVENKAEKLETKDLKVGKGPVAKKGDCLIVKYYGTLAKTGTKFDENYTAPNGFAFIVGNGQVIPGWDQGIPGMKAGGERRLIIPSSLAYGAQGSGSTIPPDSDLVFQVKLIKIQKN